MYSQTPGILSPEEYRTFWIKTVSEVNSFTISVGKGGETDAFMSHTWEKKHEKNIDFVAFSSWTGHSADWKILPTEFALTTRDHSYKYYPKDTIDPMAAYTTSGNRISTISTWGPSFTVSLDVKVHSFSPPNLKHGAWAELLRLTTTDNDCCRIGDRAPAIFTHKDGHLHITTQIGSNGNRVWDVTIQEKRWYSLELSQYKLHDKVTHSFHEAIPTIQMYNIFSTSL